MAHDIKDVLKRQSFEESRRTPDSAEVGDEITIELPDERSRGTVERVISPTRVIARLSQHTTGIKSHSYKKGSFVPADFRKGPLGLKGWYAISQEELDAAVEAEKDEPREMLEKDL